jgi:hypothetical protein
MRYAISLGIALFAAVSLAAEPPITIPLKDIWASRIESTKDVKELEPEQFGEKTKKLPSEEKFKLLHDSITQHILNALKGDVKKSFAVVGTGRAALLAASAVLVDQKPASEQFSSADEISIVFTCSSAAMTCQLEDVTRNGNRIEVPFQLTRRGDEWNSAHFALIPLGKLPTGKYEVEFVQKPKPDNLGSKYVGKSFSLEVK